MTTNKALEVARKALGPYYASLDCEPFEVEAIAECIDQALQSERAMSEKLAQSLMAISSGTHIYRGSKRVSNQQEAEIALDAYNKHKESNHE